jgi:PmbA protein
MDFKEFKELLFERAKQEGFEDCEVYYKDGESLRITIYEQEVEKYNLNKAFGLSFRGKINNKMGYSYTEILDNEAIDMLISKAKNGAMAIESEDDEFIYEGDKNYSEVKAYSKNLENIDPEKLIKLALEMEKEARDYSDKVVNIGGCTIGYNTSNYGIYNTKGLELTNKNNLLTAYVVPIVEANNEKYDGTGYITAKSIEEVDPKAIAKQGVTEALSRIGGKSIASKKYKTIIFNEAMVSLLGTFCGIFSAEATQKGLSLLKDKEGEVIASKIVTIIDDPLLENGLASTPFDDEGTKAFTKEIVSEGKLMSLFHNLKTANKAKVKTTGNGFKSSYASSIGVSPTNFYIKKGEKSLEKLIQQVEEGLIVTEFAGMHSGANSITGDFSLAAKGFYIENGKNAFPVEQITVAGNFFDLLKDIEDIGSDLKFPMSSIGSPSVVVKELSIAGN